jgi:ectoine hydroxylase-related dioxygenase (phytanoyl-CoA dioxygenase family)
VPVLKISEQEREENCLSEGFVAQASTLLRLNGYLVIENVFDPEYLAGIRAEYLSGYDSYFQDRIYSDAEIVGDKRFQITVEMRGRFNDSDLYANSLLLPIIQKTLGHDCVLGSFGSVTSLPGAESQHVHRDGFLFGGPIDALLPSFALTLIIPLVNVNETNGTTRVWKGSHVQASASVEAVPSDTPNLSLGSVMFMDYRLIHAGNSNRSSQVRPLLYIVYNRPWFNDHRNFRKQAAVSISPIELGRVPPDLRSLFAQANL